MASTLAVVFPGQGSQSVGMLRDLSDNYPLILNTFREASDVLGYDLWSTVQSGPESKLNQTHITQPALLAADVALWRIWQLHGGEQPAFLAGHSLGEYAALVCAGALDYATAISLVALRGQLMQEAVPEGEGAMAAIVGLENGTLLTICEQAAQGEVLAPANYNAIGQTVLAGERNAVLRAVNMANDAGSKLARIIPISVPSHCLLMKPAADRLALALADVTILPPQVPVINNVDVVDCREPAQIRDALVRQLYSPVRWVETIQKLASLGIARVVECGPGKVLCGLIKRIDDRLQTVSLGSVTAMQQELPIKG